MAMIQTKDLVKKFGKFTALDGVNLEINPGEIFGFIGPNGAGKTTTIRCLLGILKATSGSVQVLGLDAWKDAVEIHKKIAYVPGDVNLWSNLTGGEVIDLFINLKGKHDLKKKNELIQVFDLDPSKKCRTYSKGNRQKVALIAALASDAELLILDEPTSGLDPLMENVFQKCILDRKNDTSILLSSHILSEVEELCDRVAIIRKGKIIDSGTLDELRHLTAMNMMLETKKAIDLSSLKGVSDIQTDGYKTKLKVDAEEVGNILKYAVDYDIIHMTNTQATLEDLFMSHYKEA